MCQVPLNCGTIDTTIFTQTSTTLKLIYSPGGELISLSDRKTKQKKSTTCTWGHETPHSAIISITPTISAAASIVCVHQISPSYQKKEHSRRQDVPDNYHSRCRTSPLNHPMTAFAQHLVTAAHTQCFALLCL